MNKRKIASYLITFFIICAAVYAVNHDRHKSVEELYNDIHNSESFINYVERDVFFYNGEDQIAGTLTMPMIPMMRNKMPGVLLLHGLMRNRDYGDIPGTNESYMSYFAHMLAEHGIACLRIDFRGHGESDLDFYDHTYFTNASDIEASLDYMETIPWIDKKSLGIWGVSQGAITGAHISGNDSRVKAAVLCGPGIQPAMSFAMFVGPENLAHLYAADPDEVVSLWVDYGEYGFAFDIKRGFLVSMLEMNPLADISHYDGPLMVMMGENDTTSWPPQEIIDSFENYHHGEHYCIQIPAMDHEFSWYEGLEKVHDASCWATAFFLKNFRQSYHKHSHRRFR